jgi:hypothetical protein
LKQKTSTINALIIATGVLIIIFLCLQGYHSRTKLMDSGHSHSETSVSQNKGNQIPAEDIESTIDIALENIKKGKETGDMGLVMNEGILKLRAVNESSPDNLRAIYHLGMLSIESGQLEKAKKRFEKLVSLQPENEEYLKILNQIRSQTE